MPRGNRCHISALSVFVVCVACYLGELSAAAPHGLSKLSYWEPRNRQDTLIPPVPKDFPGKFDEKLGLSSVSQEWQENIQIDDAPVPAPVAPSQAPAAPEQQQAPQDQPQTEQPQQEQQPQQPQESYSPQSAEQPSQNPEAQPQQNPQQPQDQGEQQQPSDQPQNPSQPQTQPENGDPGQTGKEGHAEGGGAPSQQPPTNSPDEATESASDEEEQSPQPVIPEVSGASVAYDVVFAFFTADKFVSETTTKLIRNLAADSSDTNIASWQHVDSKETSERQLFYSRQDVGDANTFIVQFIADFPIESVNERVNNLESYVGEGALRSDLEANELLQQNVVDITLVSRPAKSVYNGSVDEATSSRASRSVILGASFGAILFLGLGALSLAVYLRKRRANGRSFEPGSELRSMTDLGIDLDMGQMGRSSTTNTLDQYGGDRREETRREERIQEWQTRASDIFMDRTDSSRDPSPGHAHSPNRSRFARFSLTSDSRFRSPRDALRRISERRNSPPLHGDGDDVLESEETSTPWDSPSVAPQLDLEGRPIGGFASSEVSQVESRPGYLDNLNEDDTWSYGEQGRSSFADGNMMLHPRRSTANGRAMLHPRRDTDVQR